MKVIITGATGVMGEGVMHECLQGPEAAEVLIVVRKPSGYARPKKVDIG